MESGSNENYVTVEHPNNIPNDFLNSDDLETNPASGLQAEGWPKQPNFEDVVKSSIPIDRAAVDNISLNKIPMGPESVLELERIERLETAVSDLAKFTQTSGQPSSSGSADGFTFKLPNSDFGNDLPQNGGIDLRWDQLKPMPKNIPVHKMWESWKGFLANLKKTTSIANINDQKRLSQLLYLTIGEEMQTIIRAAQLKPDFDEPFAYNKFVANVDGYLQSMVCTPIEQGRFFRMCQEINETAMDFYARLIDKVKLCGFEDAEHIWYIRAQLLKGMQNQELAQEAQTFGYDANQIVHEATRCEAFEYEQDCPSAGKFYFARRSKKESKAKRKPNRNKRLYAAGATPRRFRASAKRYIGRRGRCPRCNRVAHQNEPCPALTKECHTCGRIGHFTITCRLLRRKRTDVNTPNTDQAST